MSGTLAWSFVVASLTVLLVAAMERAARARSAAFRNRLWTAAIALLLATPPLLAFAARSASAAPAQIPTWTEAEPGVSLQWLVLAWAVPATLLTLRSIAGWILAARLARRSVPVPPGPWHSAAEAAARGLGLRGAPSLAVSPDVPGPAVVGVLRPVLLLPAEALAAPVAHRHAILRHELAHVARRDVLATRLAMVARAIHWYNPLVWWAVARLDLAAECACDDAVIRGGLSPRAYARILAAATRGRATSPALVGAGFGTAPIVKRVEALATRRSVGTAPAPRDRWVLAGATMLALMPLVVASLVLARRPHPDGAFVLPEGAAFSFSAEVSDAGPSLR